MISSEQIKAARAILGISVSDLADKAQVGSATVKRYESQTGIPIGNTRVIAQIQNALELMGVQFTGDPLKNPGVTLHLKGA